MTKIILKERADKSTTVKNLRLSLSSTGQVPVLDNDGRNFYVSEFRIAHWSSTAWTFHEQWVQNRTGGKSTVLPVEAVLVVVPTLLVIVTSDGCAGGPLTS